MINECFSNPVGAPINDTLMTILHRLYTESEAIVGSKFPLVPLALEQIKQLLMKLFYPVEDLAGYSEGTPLPIAWRTEKPEGDPSVENLLTRWEKAGLLETGRTYHLYRLKEGVSEAYWQ